jgi:prephenate dehydrogenase
MIIVPPKYDDIALLETIKELLKPADLRELPSRRGKTRPDDRVYLADGAHRLERVYQKPDGSGAQRFFGGSYMDLTRVARLNEDMWTELFFENKENILFELDYLIRSLSQYRNALADGGRAKAQGASRGSTRCKEEADAQMIRINVHASRSYDVVLSPAYWKKPAKRSGVPAAALYARWLPTTRLTGCISTD